MNHELIEEMANNAGGSLEENLGVGGSNPSHRTNLPATWTPDWLARDMVALADIGPDHSVLEPSAGKGAIVKAIHAVPHGYVEAVELNAHMVQELRETNARVRHGDFLTTFFKLPFDRVVMNPPANAIAHVHRAAIWLRRGGRLVALLHKDAATALRTDMTGARTYYLPGNTFVMKGEFRPSVLLVWDRL